MTEPGPDRWRGRTGRRQSSGDGRQQPSGDGSPQDQPEDMNPSAIACPFCGSDQTELFSLFGSSLLTSQYYCRRCRSAFERVKWGNAPLP